MTQASGRHMLVAASIVGLTVIAGSLILARSLNRVTIQLDRTVGQLDSIRVAVVDSKDALSNLQLAAAPAAPARRRGPDPKRRYAVNAKGAPSLGPEKAAITIVEFSDFQWPFCKRVGPTLQKVQQEYGDQVRIVFKHMPLSNHSKAPAAHAAAEAAYRQEMFWGMHDKIFEKQREMSPEKYLEYAAELSLDVEQYKKDIASAEVKSRIDADSKEAKKLGVTGTPAFFVNGFFLNGAKPFEAFKEIIDKELAEQKKG